jgi:hypothetical protein
MGVKGFSILDVTADEVELPMMPGRPRLTKRLISWLTGGAFVALVASSAAVPDPWLIPADGKTGPINATTTLNDLVRSYGKKNVVEREIDVGEGQTEPGVVVFPDDPLRAIEILWKDPKQKNAPKLAKIHGSASHWKTVHGISLGTSLKELEAINGKPFHLAGFGWDYPGTVYSWDDGLLASLQGHIALALDGSSDASALTESELRAVAGDQEISSHHAVMQKINPRVYQLIWIFP